MTSKTEGWVRNCLVSASGIQKTASDNQTKSEVLARSFFPKAPVAPLVPDDAQYPEPRFKMNTITNAVVDRVIRKMKPYKAPGNDEQSNSIFTNCREMLVPHLGPIFRATIKLKICPQAWKSSTTVVLRKPGKASYKNAKAHRNITLLIAFRRVYSGCLAYIISYQAEACGLLPGFHFGGRPGRTTTDALHMVTSFVKDQWRKGHIVLGLFLDIESAFPNGVPAVLRHDLLMAGVPMNLVEAISRLYDGRTTTLIFDDYRSPLINIDNGFDQGCPLSIIIYAFYNAGIARAARGKDELSPTFVDDSAYLVGAKTIAGVTRMADDMMRAGTGLDWSASHNSPYSVPKCLANIFSTLR